MGARRLMPMWIFAASCLILACTLIASSLASFSPSHENATRDETWQRHFQACQGNPEELYLQDRFRAIRGRVVDGVGKPVAGVVVQAVPVGTLLRLADVGEMSTSKWTLATSAKTLTSLDGTYEFPHLPVGLYTIFYAASGHAPAIRNLISVQDGLGAVLDIELGSSLSLHVNCEGAVHARTMMRLVPQQWWFTLPAAVIERGGKRTEFFGLGGPVRKGLIVASDPDESSPWKVVGRFDLDKSSEATVTQKAFPATRADIPESSGFAPWSD